MITKNSIENSTIDKLSALSNTLFDYIGIDDFIVYGGAISSILEKSDYFGGDVDIAIKTTSPHHISTIIQRLIDKGFKVIADRNYYIHYSEYVRLFYLINGDAMLDVAFMENPENIGVFTIDSIYYSHSHKTLINADNYFSHMNSRKIILAHPELPEHPLYIFSRLLCVAEKFNIPLDDSDIIFLISQTYKNTSEMKVFNESDIRASYLSRLIKCILKSNNRKTYIKGLVECGIINSDFSIVSLLLKRTLKNENTLSNVVDGISFMHLLYSVANEDESKELFECLGCLKQRYWAAEDFMLAHCFV